MSKTNRFLFMFLVAFFLVCVTQAQEQREKKALVDILNELQTRFQRNFSYVDKVVEGIVIEVPPEDLTFKETIRYLRRRTPLIFTVLDQNFVAVSPVGSRFDICGVLKNEQTNEVVQNAVIQASDQSVVSDENGFFELKGISKNETIIVRCLGYKTSNILGSRFRESLCEDIYLSTQIESLKEVVISSYLTKGIKKKTNGIFEINYDNFEILPGLIETDVLQTIQAFPGIQSVYETVSNLNIRGGTHDQNLILWDGIKMYQSGHFFGLISAFNPNLTKKVLLIKNGTSAGFTDGVSGTISMQTDAEVNKHFKGEIGMNLINVDGFVDLPIGKRSSLQISARKSINEVLKTPTYKQYFDKAFQNTEVVSNTDNVINSDDNFTFYDTNVRWLYNISERDQLRVNFLSVQNNLVFQENEVLESGVKFDAEYKFNRYLTFHSGYQFTETGISNLEDVNNPVFRRLIKEVVRSHGLFSEIGYHSKEYNTFLKFGTRLNYLDKFDEFIVEPRLSFNQRFLDFFTIEFLGELKHQTTSQIIDFQNDFLGVEKRRWILSNNEDIPILKSKQVSLGLHYNYKGWLLSTEGYFKEVNGITTQSQGFQNQYQFTKTDGGYRVMGVDFLINKNFNNLKMWCSYSTALNEYTFKSLEEINFRNNLDITHIVTFGTAYSFKGFKISGGLNWHEGRPTTRPVEGSEVLNKMINYQFPNSSNLEDYFRIDLSATYGFKISKGVKSHIGVSLWNMNNQKNTINNYYRLNKDNFPEEIVQTSLGVTPNLTFRMSF